jgi:hypothetical protein
MQGSQNRVMLRNESSRLRGRVVAPKHRDSSPAGPECHPCCADRSRMTRNSNHGPQHDEVVPCQTKDAL